MDSLTDQAYNQMVKKASPPSKGYRNIPMAFVIGGAICAVGHFFIKLYERMGLSEDSALPAGLITLIFLAILFTGLGVYDKLARWGGGGTLVPITGFANAIVAPAMEFKKEGLVLGLAAKMFVIAGPVLVYGIVASIIGGLVYFLVK